MTRAPGLSLAVAVAVVLFAPADATAGGGVPTATQFVFNQDRTIRGGRSTTVKVFCARGVPFTWGIRPISLPQRGVRINFILEAVIPDARGSRAGFTVRVRNPNSLGNVVQVRVSTLCIRGTSGFRTSLDPRSRVFGQRGRAAGSNGDPGLALDAQRKTVKVKRRKRVRVLCPKGHLPLQPAYDVDEGRLRFAGASPAAKRQRFGYRIGFVNETKRRDRVTAYVLCGEPSGMRITQGLGEPSARAAGIITDDLGIDFAIVEQEGIDGDGTFSGWAPALRTSYPAEGFALGMCPPGSVPFTTGIVGGANLARPLQPTSFFAFVGQSIAWARELVGALERQRRYRQSVVCGDISGFVFEPPPEGWPTYEHDPSAPLPPLFEAPECRDNFDNDGDGGIDFDGNDFNPFTVVDEDCESLDDDSESPDPDDGGGTDPPDDGGGTDPPDDGGGTDPPDGGGEPTTKCNDGVDNDGDGKVDGGLEDAVMRAGIAAAVPADPGCLTGPGAAYDSQDHNEGDFSGDADCPTPDTGKQYTIKQFESGTLLRHLLHVGGTLRVDKGQGDADFDAGSLAAFQLTCSNGTVADVTVTWTRDGEPAEPGGQKPLIEYVITLTYVSGPGGGTFSYVAAPNTR